MYLKGLSLLLACIALVQSKTIPTEEPESPSDDVYNSYFEFPDEDNKPLYLDLITPSDVALKNENGDNCQICAFVYGFLVDAPYNINYFSLNSREHSLFQYATEDGGCKLFGDFPTIGYGWCCDDWLPDNTIKVDILDCNGNEITLDFITQEAYDKNTGELIPKPYIEAREVNYEFTSSVDDEITPFINDEIISFIGDEITSSVGDEIISFIGNEITSSINDDIISFLSDEITSSVDDEITPFINDEITPLIGDEITSSVDDETTSTVDDDIISFLSDAYISSVNDEITPFIDDEIISFISIIGDEITSSIDDETTSTVDDEIISFIGDEITSSVDDEIMPFVNNDVTFAVDNE